MARLGRPKIHWRQRALAAEAELKSRTELSKIHDQLVAKHHKCEIMLNKLLAEKLETWLRQVADDSGLAYKDVLQLSLPIFSKIFVTNAKE